MLICLYIIVSLLYFWVSWLCKSRVAQTPAERRPERECEGYNNLVGGIQWVFFGSGVFFPFSFHYTMPFVYGLCYLYTLGLQKMLIWPRLIIKTPLVIYRISHWYISLVSCEKNAKFSQSVWFVYIYVAPSLGRCA